jgi:hypothetical protein
MAAGVVEVENENNPVAMFPGDVFLDLLDMQHRFWSQQEGACTKLEEAGVLRAFNNYKTNTFDRLFATETEVNNNTYNDKLDDVFGKFADGVFSEEGGLRDALNFLKLPLDEEPARRAFFKLKSGLVIPKEEFRNLVKELNGGLCTHMISEMSKVTPAEVNYDLVMDILKEVKRNEGYVGHNITLENARDVDTYMTKRLSQIKPASAEPWLLVTVGVQGVGKGNVISNALEYFPTFEGLGDDSGYFNCDPDEIYKVLRRQATGPDKDPPTRDFVNYWNHVSFGVALTKGSNIIFDGSGRESKNICGRTIARALERNYRIGFLVVTLPMTRIIGQIYERNKGERQTGLGYVKETAVRLISRVREYDMFCNFNRDQGQIVYIANNRPRPKQVELESVLKDLKEWNAPIASIQEHYDNLARSLRDKRDFPLYLYLHLPDLTSLNLKRRAIGDKELQAFVSAVASGSLPNLTHLDLSHNEITNMDELAAVASESLPNLTNLDLSHNKITGLDELAVVAMRLTHLDLSHNEITDKGLDELAVVAMPNLTHLGLSHNKITDKGLDELAVVAMPNLTHLDLSHNKITDKGLDELAVVAMESLPNLTHLDLSHNKITDKGVNELAVVVMESLPRLTHLDLSQNVGITADSMGLSVLRNLSREKINIKI